jgi:hypothetical protein
MATGTGSLAVNHPLFRKDRPMTIPFFSRTAQLAIGVALVGVIVYAIVSLAPVALARWF